MATLIESGAVGRPPQRWARWAAWGAFACAVPSVLWRLAMLAGADLGFAEAGLFREDPGLVVYVLVLDAAEILAGLACLGLVMAWGERLPRWIPGIGGRRIHRLLPTVLGATGAAALAGIFVPVIGSIVLAALGVTEGWTPSAAMSGWQTALLFACYLPLLAWPVLLVIALVGYWTRRAPMASVVDQDGQRLGSSAT